MIDFRTFSTPKFLTIYSIRLPNLDGLLKEFKTTQAFFCGGGGGGSLTLLGILSLSHLFSLQKKYLHKYFFKFRGFKELLKIWTSSYELL